MKQTTLNFFVNKGSQAQQSKSKQNTQSSDERSNALKRKKVIDDDASNEEVKTALPGNAQLPSGSEMSNEQRTPEDKPASTELHSQQINKRMKEINIHITKAPEADGKAEGTCSEHHKSPPKSSQLNDVCNSQNASEASSAIKMGAKIASPAHNKGERQLLAQTGPEGESEGTRLSVLQHENSQSQALLKCTANLKPISHEAYDIVSDAPFFAGQNVPFSFLVDTFEQVAEIKGKDSKAQIVEILSKMFRSFIVLNRQQLVMCYYFCILRIAPDYEDNELGVGREILMKALEKTCGRSARQIRQSLQEEGDLGLVAAKSRTQQSSLSTFFTQKKEKPPITLQQVFSSLKEIAFTHGDKSNQQKEGVIIKLLLDSKPAEAKYIIRFIEKNLKIGNAEKTMQQGLTKALFNQAHFGNKKAPVYSAGTAQQYEVFQSAIQRALCEYPNYDAVIGTLLEIGKEIERLPQICKITPGTPCKPMLAKPQKSISAILNRFEGKKFTCEFKYDGLRGQIHYSGGKVHIFSRNLENMTEVYPDIVQFIHSHIGSCHDLQNFILDSEIVAFDTLTNKIKSFQQLASRSRKNVSLEEINVKVCIFMFDLIYLNGRSLIDLPLEQRRQKIGQHFVMQEGKIQFAEYQNTDNLDEIQDLLAKSIKMGCEGLMVKTLEVDSTYEPAKRSFKWLKLKKDYLDSGLGDSFDLVPIGAFYGTGKRKGFYGAYILACYNEDMERYETICKIGTGFSDENLMKFYQQFQDHIIKEPLPEYYVGDFQADVWFDLCAVWEVKGADLQISPVYTAAYGEAAEQKGIGLRFPRLLKQREDKKPIEATTAEQICEIYKSQAIVDKDQAEQDEDDDYY